MDPSVRHWGGAVERWFCGSEGSEGSEGSTAPEVSGILRKGLLFLGISEKLGDGGPFPAPREPAGPPPPPAPRTPAPRTPAPRTPEPRHPEPRHPRPRHPGTQNPGTQNPGTQNPGTQNPSDSDKRNPGRIMTRAFPGQDSDKRITESGQDSDKGLKSPAGTVTTGVQVLALLGFLRSGSIRCRVPRLRRP